jgi:hypothetical protein
MNVLVASSFSLPGCDVMRYYYYLIKLKMGVYPVAVYYNKTQHTNNTAHKTTQTIKDTIWQTLIDKRVQPTAVRTPSFIQNEKMALFRFLALFGLSY